MFRLVSRHHSPRLKNDSPVIKLNFDVFYLEVQCYYIYMQLSTCNYHTRIRRLTGRDFTKIVHKTNLLYRKIKYLIILKEMRNNYMQVHFK